MTASRQRLVSAIRGIARTDPDLANAIAKTSNKGDQAGASSSASSSGEESRVCCDGTTGAANAGTTQTDPDATSQEGLDPNDPANLGDMGAGSLTGLTDCATGDPVCFDGADYTLPDGWDDPQEPPVDPTYKEGFYYIRVGNAFCDFADDDTKSPTVIGAILNPPIASVDFYEKTDEGSGSSDVYYWEGTHDAGGSAAGYVCMRECVPEDGGYCDPTEEEITAVIWPFDSCVNLAIKNGTIVGSKYDPENDGTYSKPMAELTLCDGSGNQVNIKTSADGGWKSVNGTTGEDGYLYNAQGEQIAHIDGNEYNDPLI